jgi:hypothetical protein
LFPTPPSLLPSRPPNLACTLYMKNVMHCSLIKKVKKLKKLIIRSNSLHSYSIIRNLTPLPATQNPAIKLFLPTENIRPFILS